MGLEISKFNSTLVLVFAMSFLNLNSQVLMVWSLLTFPWDLYERLLNTTNPDVLVGLEKLLWPLEVLVMASELPNLNGS